MMGVQKLWRGMQNQAGKPAWYEKSELLVLVMSGRHIFKSGFCHTSASSPAQPRHHQACWG
jgi:hypothetical protein